MSKMTSQAWRGAVLVLIALTAVGAIGCRRGGRIQTGLSVRYQRNLLRLAARDTGCAVNQLAPMQIGAGPDVFAVTGCSFPVEYWLQCGRRGRRCRWSRVPTLNEQAAPVLQCQPQMIQQQLTQAPNMRIAVGCGRQATFAMTCNGAACGWTMTGPAQAPAPGAIAAVPPPPGGAVGVAAVPPPPGGATGDGTIVAGQLQAQREAILSCLDSPSVVLSIRWTTDGVIQVRLPPELAGSAAEGCVQAALSTIRVTAQQAGEITVPVQ